mgnify:CR=1 FL=1
MCPRGIHSFGSPRPNRTLCLDGSCLHAYNYHFGDSYFHVDSGCRAYSHLHGGNHLPVAVLCVSALIVVTRPIVIKVPQTIL